MADIESDTRSRTLGRDRNGSEEHSHMYNMQSIPEEQFEKIRSILKIQRLDKTSAKRPLVRLAIELGVTSRLYRGQILIAQGDFRTAGEFFREAHQIADAIDDSVLMGRCCFWEGIVDVKYHSHGTAAFLFLRAANNFAPFLNNYGVLSMSTSDDPNQPCLEMRLLPGYLRAYHRQIMGVMMRNLSPDDWVSAAQGITDFMQQGQQSVESPNTSPHSELFGDLYSGVALQHWQPTQNGSGPATASGSAISASPSRNSAQSFIGVDDFLQSRLNKNPRRPQANNLISREPVQTQSTSSVGRQGSSQESRLGNNAVYGRPVEQFFEYAERASDLSASGGEQRSSSSSSAPSDAAEQSAERTQELRDSLLNLLAMAPSRPQSSLSVLESDQHRAVSKEVELSDALAPQVLEQRVENVTGRRRTSIDNVLATLAIETVDEPYVSDADGQLRHSRRQSTEPSISSPLRESFQPED